MRRIQTLLCSSAFVGLVVASACSSNSDTAPAAPTANNNNTTNNNSGLALLTGITVAPDAFTLMVEETQQLSVTGSFDDGSTSPVSIGLSYSSSDNAVATVSDSGLVTGVAAGLATITTELGTLTDAVEVTVEAPLPCLFDQGGEINRGCEPGFVCNLQSGECVPGKSCTDSAECNSCSDTRRQGGAEQCGHGFNVTAWCDPNHGNVCTRSRAPCEPCTSDSDCGLRDFRLTGANRTQLECLEYEDGSGQFCTRPSNFGCPDGFQANTDGQCVRAAGCAALPFICPENMDAIPACTGTGQLCVGETCPETGGARCSTNNEPGAVGTCIGFCDSNDDCPPSLPICNPRNGICISPCSKGSCPAGQVCHLDGFCAAPCTDNESCTDDARYGTQSYCNTGSPPQPPPRFFKTYHDTNSCQALGCERNGDCGNMAGRVCNSLAAPPECVPGCFETDDCGFGNVCKNADQPPPGQSYNREQCRALPNMPDDNETLIGACCNPGCLDRDLQCGLNEWCCGEPDSPYEEPTTCLAIDGAGGRQALPGECFPLADSGVPTSVQQWCSPCNPMESNFDFCSGDARGQILGPDLMTPGWYPGLNRSEPTLNGGQPFRELEQCVTVAMGLAFCSTTCDPQAEDKACPGRGGCAPVFAQCCQDSDCGDLTCVGADCGNPMNPVAGRCQCGENGVQAAQCPSEYNLVDRTVPFPRCVEANDAMGTMFCLVSYNCLPAPVTVDPDTNQVVNYPAACLP